MEIADLRFLPQSSFNGILTFVGYSVPKPYLYKKSNGTIQSIAWGGGE